MEKQKGLARRFPRKDRQHGCRCKRARKGVPKVPRGACGVGKGKWQPSVEERIVSNRLARSALRFVQSHDPEDFQE